MKVFELASLVFGKSACMELDFCHYLPGVSRKLRDDAFLVNIKKAPMKKGLISLAHSQIQTDINPRKA